MSLFESETNDTKETTSEDSGTNQGSYLQKLVETKGEQWRDPEVLAKGKHEADQFIEKLKKENEELRASVLKADKTEELLTLIREKATTPEVTSEQSKDKGEVKGSETKGTDDIDLKSLVESTLKEFREKETAAEKVKRVEEGLKTLYGDSVKTKLQEHATSLGMSLKDLGDFAAKSPEAFFKLIGEKTPEMKVPSSTVNTAGTKPNSGLRDSAYYNSLRKELGTKFWKPEIQDQILRDKMALGDKF